MLLKLLGAGKARAELLYFVFDSTVREGEVATAHSPPSPKKAVHSMEAVFFYHTLLVYLSFFYEAWPPVPLTPRKIPRHTFYIPRDDYFFF